MRLVGWHKDAGRYRPLLHAKLCVLAATWFWEGEFGEETLHLTPLRTWVGSANWTNLTASHIQFGAWWDDGALAGHALRFLTDLILLSEPPGQHAAGPEPQLVAAEWDDDAFADYAAEYGPDYDDGHSQAFG